MRRTPSANWTASRSKDAHSASTKPGPAMSVATAAVVAEEAAMTTAEGAVVEEVAADIVAKAAVEEVAAGTAVAGIAEAAVAGAATVGIPGGTRLPASSGN
jgi:hypothetical protein